MATTPIYVSRLVKLPLLDRDGTSIGKVDDLVLGPATRESGPLLLGLVAVVNRSRIFVSASRIGELDGSGVRLRTADVDLRSFRLRTSELLTSSLFDRKVDGEIAVDFGLAPCVARPGSWEIASVALTHPGPLRRRRSVRTVPWFEVAELFDAGDVAREVAALRSMHPSDIARQVSTMPEERRHAVTTAMDDEDLADLLQELPEAEQAGIIEGLETARAAHVIEEMEPDDAADLLAELDADDRGRLLAAMDPEEADPLRRLLVYDSDTAGGLMTPEPIILVAPTTVAEALARIREQAVPAAIATTVFVVDPPTQPPTGAYLGAVSFQRLLREAPGSPLSDLVDGRPAPIAADLSEIEVAERLAAYDLLALPVCDSAGRLLGAVTVDDVLDRTLPAGWRSH
jgi:flagellar motility protein MotE (MotC chaperone)